MLMIFLVALNITLYLISVGLWIVLTEFWILNLSLSCFGLCLTAWIIYQKKNSLIKLYPLSGLKKSGETILRFFLLFCILGTLNYLAFKHPKVWDLSLLKNNSLSTQSLKVLDSMKGQVDVKIFCTRAELPAIEALLDLYRFHKNDLSFEFIDVNLRPDLVKKYNILESGVVVFEYNQRRFDFKIKDELSVTNGLIRVSRAKDPLIFWSLGNGEMAIEGKQASLEFGGSFVLDLIKKSAYTLQFGDLDHLALEGEQKPDLVVLWNLTQKLRESQVDKLKKYLLTGGHLLLGLDPFLSLKPKLDPAADLRHLIKGFGIRMNVDLVVDNLNFYQGSQSMIPIVYRFSESSPITRTLTQKVFFPLVSSVQKINPNGRLMDGEVQILAYSTPFPASWAEKSMKEISEGKIFFNKGIDDQGPLNYALSFEAKGGIKTRIVAIGNSAFVQNRYSQFSENFNFFMNSVAWLTNKDELISFSDGLQEQKLIIISDFQRQVIFCFSFIFAPSILLGMAGMMFYRRNYR